MTLPNRITKLAIGVGAISLMAGSATAGDYGKAIIDDKMPIEAWEFCDIFDIPTLYESDSGFIRSVALTGRYHGQYISASEDVTGLAGNGFHRYDHRRFRQGIEIGFANDISFSASADITDRGDLTTDRFINNWDEFILEWAPSKDQYIIVGKQKNKITIENETSSNRILTIERSAITSEVISDKPWGVSFGFKALDIKHELGVFMTGSDAAPDAADVSGYRWAETDSRGMITYRATKKITDATELHFDYMFTNNASGAAVPQGDPRNGNRGGNYEHVLALGTKSTWGDLGLITDLIYGANRSTQGGGNGAGAIPAGDDTFGLIIMPYYNFTDKLQGVARYAYMDSGRENTPGQYAVRQNVEDYHTFYAGLNYYICGDNLKLMAGYEYATGELFGTATDIDTSSWMLGMRVSY